MRKVVATNSQGKKKTVKNLGKKNKAVKSLNNFNLIALWYFKNCLTVRNCKSGYMKVGIPLEVRYFLMSLSVPYQLKLGVE